MSQDYEAFFTEMWSEDKRYATIDGAQVRILTGRVNRDYANSMGITLVSDSCEITLVRSELGDWKPRPGARLTINGKQYEIYQDIPAQSLDPDDALVKLTIHPA